MGRGRKLIQAIERLAPRAVWMIPICVIGFNLWRGQPYPLAHAVNAAGVMAIILALSAFRMAPREVVSTALLCLLGACVATLATASGEASNIARVFIGGLFLIAAWTASEHAETAWDKALAVGLWSEVAAWALGNASRGTFGSDVAVSAIGQAYGPLAQPAQWAVIAAAYLWAVHRWRTGKG
jgi:hypothetical protein